MAEKEIKILALQFASKIAQKFENFKTVERLLEGAQCMQPDVVILPEVWTVGWSCRDFRGSAESITNSETVAFLSSLAKKYNTNIIGGSFISKDNECNFYNTCPVFNKKGELVAQYNKMHLYSYYGCNENQVVKAGIEPIMVELDGVKFGLTICYDIRFPEIYRAYRKAGADVLVNVAAWSKTKKMQWKMMTKSRAIENQTYMIAVNSIGEIENDENLGDTRILNYLGETLSKCSKFEGTAFSKIKIKDMYDFREKCTILEDVHEQYNVRIK